jgi:SRSO17 transposase
MRPGIKEGNKTDYGKRQYIGNLGKIENGIVAVTAYGLFEGITFPLALKFISLKHDYCQEIRIKVSP